MISDTIVAPATPYGIGGIAVVRLSGPRSIFIVGNLINNNSSAANLKPRVATLFNLQDETGAAIDESIITFFQSPNSYTGEDLIEISCHGNPIVVDKIISNCCRLGARIAEPGEFTKRAFINGKMDLVQAEAVTSLIHSQSAESSQLNLRILRGELSQKLNDISKNLVHAVSIVEFELDISEERLQPDLNNQLLSMINELVQKISKLLESHKQARMLNHGATVVIAGAPNVGKSTLLNALTETDRAITSTSPGTTRDAIDVRLVLDGVPINLIDTAGIHNSTEEIEQKGINKTFNYLKKADLIIIVHDPGLVDVPPLKSPENIPAIDIMNKSDLLSDSQSKHLKGTHRERIFLSAKTEDNVHLLKQQIKISLGVGGSLSDTVTTTTSRQHNALKDCHNKLNAATELLNSPRCAYEIIAIELREALDAVGVILGKTTPDDILHNIFNQFCVGK
jgi:tRNA modification GTPase